MSGKFITFEGGEGSGKSTLIRMVEDNLKSRGYEVMVTREPGGIGIAEQIREVILSNHNTDMDGLTEAFLFAAARRQHLIQKVLPALNEGTIVLCDRFVDSSIVYQGYARGLGMDKVKEINDIVIDGHYPELTLFIKVRPEIGLARIRENDRNMNRLDVEVSDFHDKVFEGYKLLSEQEDRIHDINGEQDVESVFRDTMALIERVID